jgi:hypothetical protein
LGLLAGSEWVEYYIGKVAAGSLDPTAQLQPVNKIRIANGKKQTEQFYFVADYLGNLKYATVVYKQLII